MLVALVFLVLLAVLGIYSTFLGAENAQSFFNTLPLTVYWIALTALLFAGIATFRRLLREPWLFMIHAGVIVILVGAMWSSEKGHILANKIFDTEKIPSGYMVLFERRPYDVVMNENMRTQAGTLPFKLNLLSFWLEYYRSGPATITGVNASGEPFTYALSDEFPEEFDIDENTKLFVLETFTNFKVNIQERLGTPVDQQGYGENPALEIEIQTSEGRTRRGFLFEKFPSMNSAGAEYNLRYSAGRITGISDYKSYVQVLSSDGSKALAAAIIEVNKPLEIGGYHFYQYSYEPDNLEYTVLAVVSNSGLFSVYLGYWMLGIGVAGLFWIKPVLGYFKQKKPITYGN